MCTVQMKALGSGIAPDRKDFFEALEQPEIKANCMVTLIGGRNYDDLKMNKRGAQSTGLAIRQNVDTYEYVKRIRKQLSTPTRAFSVAMQSTIDRSYTRPNYTRTIEHVTTASAKTLKKIACISCQHDSLSI